MYSVMSNENSLAIFKDYQIRRVYDEDTGIWYFSVVDIIQVLIQQPDYQTARKYWNKLKERLKKEGSQSVTNCHRLKLEAADGKQYLTDRPFSGSALLIFVIDLEKIIERVNAFLLK